ncbi:MAG: hypothetical protein Q8R37_03445 [Nanoarchaeota archaeon]|nr:hypothetical protein [Nanoarchaeota archaeon]
MAITKFITSSALLIALFLALVSLGCSPPPMKVIEAPVPEPLPLVEENTAPEMVVEEAGVMVESQTHTVEIKNDGFQPQSVTITVGDTVSFVNKNTVSHWPASAVHPTHTAYPGSDITKCSTSEKEMIFDACAPLKAEDSWSFIFTEKGSWKYHDHLNPRFTGTIIVE